MAQLNDLIVAGASRLLNGLGVLGSANMDSIFPNITETYDLGSSDKRWNLLYAKTLNTYQDTTDILTVKQYATIGNGAEASAADAKSGVLRVTGGISVTKKSYFGHSVYFANGNNYYIDNLGNAKLLSFGLKNGGYNVDVVLETRDVKNSNNVLIESVSGLVTSNKSFLELRGFAPPTMYHTTGDRPAPYGIGFGNGSESAGIVPIGEGDKLQEIMFYGANSGPTLFTWKCQIWDNTTYDSKSTNRYSSAMMSLNSKTGDLYVKNTVGIGGTNTGYTLYVNGSSYFANYLQTTQYFKSTVATGIAPVQVASTTLNTNLNADLLDGWHKQDVLGTYYLTSGTADLSHYWCKLWSATIKAQQYNNTGISIYVQSQYDGKYGLFSWNVRQNGTNNSSACDFSIGLYEHFGNISSSDIRLYYDNSTGVCEIWVNCWARYGVWNYSVLKKCYRTASDSQIIGTFHEANFTTTQTLPTSSYINATYTPFLGNAASATKLQTARTINGTNFDGTGAITTSYWGTSRSFTISDSSQTNKGTAVSVNGSGAVNLLLPATIKASLSGTATSSYFPYGFGSYSTSNAAWGNQTGTTVVTWNDSTGGSVDWRRDNPSSGKTSMKVDGRVYVNEGNTPVATLTSANGYWGMGNPDGGTSDWIRTTANGILPYQSGGASSLGTSSWPFGAIYGNSIYGTLTGNASSATILKPTDNTSTTTYKVGTWAANTSGGYIVWREAFTNSNLGSDTGDIIYWLNGATTLNVTIDGNYYAVGSHLVLHAGNYSSYAAPASHGHNVTQISWAGTQNLTCTGTNTEWSVDMDSTAANSYFHIWSGIKGNSCMQFENNTGLCRAPFGVYGGVWNDYAEYRNQVEEIKPGYCVASSDDGKVYKTSKKFQPCDGITSDTFGFAIGETDECKTPLAVAGRVLAYCIGDRNDYHAGDTVCAGPEGKVMKMTRDEILMWPDRIVGIVSEIPNYKVWGTGNVEVNDRIWIKIK